MTYPLKYNSLKRLMLSDDATNPASDSNAALAPDILAIDVQMTNHAISPMDAYFHLLRLCSEDKVSSTIAMHLFKSGYDIHSMEGSLCTRVLLTHLLDTADPHELASRLMMIQNRYKPVSLKDYVFVTMTERCEQGVTGFLDKLMEIKKSDLLRSQQEMDAFINEAVTQYQHQGGVSRQELKTTIWQMASLIHKVNALQEAASLSEPSATTAALREQYYAIVAQGNQLKERVHQMHSHVESAGGLQLMAGIGLIIIGSAMVLASLFITLIAPLHFFSLNSIGESLGISMPVTYSVLGIGGACLLGGIYALFNGRPREKSALVKTTDTLVERSEHVSLRVASNMRFYRSPQARDSAPKSDPAINPRFLSVHRT